MKTHQVKAALVTTGVAIFAPISLVLVAAFPKTAGIVFGVLLKIDGKWVAVDSAAELSDTPS
jgi:predicted Kef-type K+ transport protein